MKKSTKVLLGIGVTAAIGASVAYVVSDTLLEKIEAHKNRTQLKELVKEKLGGSQKALDFIDQMSFEDLKQSINLVDRVGQFKETVGTYTDGARDVAEDAVATLFEYLERLKH